MAVVLELSKRVSRPERFEISWSVGSLNVQVQALGTTEVRLHALGLDKLKYGDSSEFRWPSGAGLVASGRRSGGRWAPVGWPLGAG